MDFLSKSDAQKWCIENKIPLDEELYPNLEQAEEFVIPSDAGKRVALVRRHLATFDSCDEVLIWISQWGVWPSGERMHIFYQFRKSYGENRMLKEAPAHLVKSKEIEDGISIVTLAVLFLWDCYILTKDNQKFCFYSHDEYGLLKL